MSVNEEDFWIPRTLDAPALFFLWELDSAILFIGWSLLGAIMGGMGFLFGIVLGWGSARAYSQLKEEGGRGLIIKILFWFTPSEFWASKKHPSHVREYIGK